MSGGHTPGPWKRNRHAACSVENDAGRGVCSTGGYQDNFSDGLYASENEANARRIVDCVNACEGIADPSVVPELVAVCVRATEEAKLGDGVRADTLNLMLEALAKARGDAQ